MSNISPEAEIDLDVYQDTESRLKAAAVFLIARRGYHGTSVRDIAKAAGLTNAGVYHFVENKEALLIEIMRNGQKLLFDSTVARLEKTETSRHKLAVLVGILAGVHGKNRLTSFVTDGEIRSLTPDSAGQLEILSLRDEYEQLWNDVIEAGVASGEFSIKNSRLTKLALINMCTGVSAWYRPEGPNTLEEIISDLVEYALRLAGALAVEQTVTTEDMAAIDLQNMPTAKWEPVLKQEVLKQEEV